MSAAKTRLALDNARDIIRHVVLPATQDREPCVPVKMDIPYVSGHARRDKVLSPLNF